MIPATTEVCQNVVSFCPRARTKEQTPTPNIVIYGMGMNIVKPPHVLMLMIILFPDWILCICIAFGGSLSASEGLRNYASQRPIRW